MNHVSFYGFQANFRCYLEPERSKLVKKVFFLLQTAENVMIFGSWIFLTFHAPNIFQSLPRSKTIQNREIVNSTLSDHCAVVAKMWFYENWFILNISKNIFRDCDHNLVISSFTLIAKVVNILLTTYFWVSLFSW